MRESKRRRQAKRSKAHRLFFLDANPVYFKGHRLNILPRYTKARESDFPTHSVPVNSTRLFMVNGVQIVIDYVAERVINPFRLPFGEVGKSRHSPALFREKDARKHVERVVLVNQKRVLVGAKIVAKKGEQYQTVPVYEKQGGTPVFVKSSDDFTHKTECITA